MIAVMCFGLCTAAYANGQGIKQYDKYVSLGDSISCGFTPEYVGDPDLWFTGSSQAYCWKVEKAVGASDTYFGGFSGARSEELYLALGGKLTLDVYNSEGGYYADFFSKMMQRTDELQQAVADTDLITMCIGANDICLYPITSAGLTAADFAEGSDKVELAAKIAKVVEYIYKGYNNLMDTYPKLLDRIYALNPDVDLVVTSIYNPFWSAPLTDETVLPIGTAVTVVTDLVNSKLSEMAALRGARFVDISSVESWYNTLQREPVSILSNAEDFLLNIHPTEAGYDYIARQLLNALSTEVKPISSDITVDLSGIDADGIYYVAVNGVKTDDYTVEDDNTIVIKYSGKLAVTATVKSKSEGKTQMYVWTLEKTSNGYKAYGFTKSGDVEQHKETVSTKMSNAASNMKNGLKKLFGR